MGVGTETPVPVLDTVGGATSCAGFGPYPAELETSMADRFVVVARDFVP